jgi:hypothetical protein
MQTRVGEHWTVAIALAHLAWWDRRVMYVLDRTAQDGKLFIPEIDIFVNDLSLPLWAPFPHVKRRGSPSKPPPTSMRGSKSIPQSARRDLQLQQALGCPRPAPQRASR